MTWLKDLFDYTLSIPFWQFAVWSLILFCIGILMTFKGNKKQL